MKLTMLGTGCAMVTGCYNTCFALEDGDRCFLVDAGGGNLILDRLQKAGIDWRNIRDIFVTHKHIDHIMGIIWMIRLYCQDLAAGKFDADVNIYAHDEVIAILRQMSELLLVPKQSKFIGKKVRLVTVEEGDTVSILGRDVTFFDIRSTKAKQFGFTMALEGGRKFTCCGDEPYNECNAPYVLGSQWLLHEAFCLYGQRDVFKPYEKHHSTVKDACEMAEKMGIPNLLLYHTEDKNILNRKELYMEEGKQYYKGNLFVPDDMEAMEIC